MFPRVIDSGKMLRNFVQILRSGAVGRKSLGTRPKKLVQRWLLEATEKQLLNADVGNAPSLADVVKMVHPKPAEAWCAAWFAWLIGKPHDEAALPPATRAFERFKRDATGEPPDVPFQMLTALGMTPAQWAQVARAGSWQMVRQNLNTFARHGVFEQPGMAKAIAAKLRDPQAVARARVLPYQLMSAFKAAGEAVPAVVQDALQDAMELAIGNVPSLHGRVVVCPDVSGSMRSSVTGWAGSATSTVNPRDSVMTNAQKLAGIGGGGTSCSAPLARLNRERAQVDLVILVSDNESWMDARRSGATATMREWETLKQRNPGARLVCIDIQPHATTQAAERADILNVGGFSDAVFEMIANFAEGAWAPATGSARLKR
ncbi:hypothetical protein WJ968_01900 [Achromobacter xylosoxidans]